VNEPDDLRDEAAEILSRREFREPTQSRADRVFEWIGDRLASIFDQFGFALPSGTSDIVSWLIILIVVVVVVWTARRAFRSRGLAKTSSQAPLSSVLRRRRDAAYWLDRASQAERSGDYAAAVRAYYRSGTARLVDHGRLPDEPGATARRWSTEVVAPSAEEAEALGEITAAFEGVWFGGQESDLETAQRIAAEAAKVGQS
jgi:hypothetical protein